MSRTRAALTPLEKLREFLETRPRAFADFERDLHARLIAAETNDFDVDDDAVVIEGKLHRRVLRAAQTYDDGS